MKENFELQKITYKQALKIDIKNLESNVNTM